MKIFKEYSVGLVNHFFQTLIATNNGIQIRSAWIMKTYRLFGGIK